MATMASREMPYRRSWVGAGDGVAVEDRVDLVAGQQAGDHVEQRQRGEQHGGGDDGAVLVVADLVGHQRRRRSSRRPGCRAGSSSARESTGAPTGRGGRAIRPVVGWSKPRAMAIGMSTTMFSQRICSGLSGTPPAMPKMPGAEEDGDVGDQRRHLEAEVLHQVVVERAAVGDGVRRWWRSCRR